MTSRIALGVVFLVTGTLWLLSTAGVLDLSYRAWIGVVLITIGLAIALIPGRHGFLVLLGILVALAGVPALVVHGDVFGGGIGDRVESPSAAVDLEQYRQGIGKLTIDLTSPALRTEDLDVEASVGIGELVVLVPTEVEVTIDAHAGIGSIQAFGGTEGGFDVDLVVDRDRGSSEPGARLIELGLEVGIGAISVERRD